MDISTAQLILGATNRLDSLDAALLRPGRLELQVLVAQPDLLDRADILGNVLRKRKLSSHIHVHHLAATTEGASAAELVSLCRDAAFIALDQDPCASEINTHHFLEAMTF